jgi:hypothetical protein
MPRSTRLDPDALDDVLREQFDVIAGWQAAACGLTRAALAHRIRPGGPWQRLLPGVYFARTGTSTVAAQKDLAALLYAGSGSVLTGPAALRFHGLTSSDPALCDVLTPYAHQVRSAGFVAVHPTTRMPRDVVAIGVRRYAAPARAVADTARDMTELREVRAIVASAVQRGKCSPDLMADELRGGPRRGSALFRRALQEVLDGIRSTAEGDLLDLIKHGRLPVPMLNARLIGPDGRLIAIADAWWPDAGVAVEVDSREWHLSPAHWQQTMSRHAEMSRHGIIVLHFSPQQIRTKRSEVLEKITGALTAGRARPPLPIRALPNR